jgi:hypothetical protein
MRKVSRSVGGGGVVASTDPSLGLLVLTTFGVGVGLVTCVVGWP